MRPHEAERLLTPQLGDKCQPVTKTCHPVAYFWRPGWQAFPSVQHSV